MRKFLYLFSGVTLFSLPLFFADVALFIICLLFVVDFVTGYDLMGGIYSSLEKIASEIK